MQEAQRRFERVERVEPHILIDNLQRPRRDKAMHGIVADLDEPSRLLMQSIQPLHHRDEGFEIARISDVRINHGDGVNGRDSGIHQSKTSFLNGIVVVSFDIPIKVSHHHALRDDVVNLVAHGIPVIKSLLTFDTAHCNSIVTRCE